MSNAEGGTPTQGSTLVERKTITLAEVIRETRDIDIEIGRMTRLIDELRLERARLANLRRI